MPNPMCPLNLPPAPLSISKVRGRIMVFDVLRKKHVALTPEEWVRQHFIHYLITEKGYPAALMCNEMAITLNGMSRRCDSVLYDTQLHPRMIIEFKAPEVSLTQKVFDQISRYNIVMHVDYLIISNGLTHYCCRMDYDNGTYQFLREIPDYTDL